MSDHIAPVNPPSLMKPVGYAHGYEVRGATRESGEIPVVDVDEIYYLAAFHHSSTHQVKSPRGAEMMPICNNNPSRLASSQHSATRPPFRR